MAIIIIGLSVAALIGFVTGFYISKIEKRMANIVSAGLMPFEVKKPCLHKNLITRVITTAATCETKAQFCADCGQRRTNPEIECR